MIVGVVRDEFPCLSQGLYLGRLRGRMNPGEEEGGRDVVRGKDLEQRRVVRSRAVAKVRATVLPVPGADVTKPAAGGGHDVVGDGVDVVAMGDGVVAVGRARADGVPVLVGAGGLVDMLKGAGIPEQALRTSADASVTYQEGPIRTERA